MKLSKLVVIASFCLLLNACSTKKGYGKRFKFVYNPEKLEKKGFPRRIGFVNDYENLLMENQKSELEKTISDFHQKTGNEIVIVIVDSIDPYSNLINYIKDISHYWKIGQLQKGCGLTVVLSKKLHRISICPAFETSLTITKKDCKEIIEKIFVPTFKEKRYYDGFKTAISEIMLKWD